MCTKLITAIFCVIFITACGAGGGSGPSAAKAVPGGGTSDPSTVTPPTGSTPSTDPALTLYTATSTESVTSGGQAYTVTMTGYCTVYESNTYCWDDGWHRPIASLGYDYWGFIVSGSTTLQGSEGAADATDPMENTPTMITSAIINQLPGNVIEPDGSESTMVTRLLATGTQTTVNCTVTATAVDCGSLTLAVQQ